MEKNGNSLLNYLESNPIDLRVSNLYKSFPGKEVLKGLNLHVGPAETHVILGKSGVGKSLLLKCICGLEPYDSGSVYLNGDEINLDAELSRFKIGFVFQSSALFNSMSVSDNVGIYLREHRLVKDEDQYRTLVEGALELVGLSGVEKQFPSELSGGMKRRVATARVLMMSPDLILFDEPTTGLDPMMTKTIGELVVTLKESINTTQVVVTHDIEFGKYIADRISIISDGKIIDVGEPGNLENSNNEVVQSFISKKFIDREEKYEERV